MGLFKDLFKTITKPIRVKAKGKEGERKVSNVLTPLFFGKDNHRLINDIIFEDENGKTHQIDHIEIRTNGIFVIETKNYKGWIFGNENNEHWTQTLYNGEKHQFLNPLKQNKSHCYCVSKVLGGKYRINSLIVMVENNADKIECDNVVNLKDLKRYLEKFNDGTSISMDEVVAIMKKLNQAASDKTTREHVNNIKETQNDIKHNICPRCGGKLVRRKSDNGYFYGCSNYPKCRFIKK